MLTDTLAPGRALSDLDVVLAANLDLLHGCTVPAWEDYTPGGAADRAQVWAEGRVQLAPEHQRGD